MNIQTKRLTLHPFQKSDALLLYNYRKQEIVEKYQSFDHFTLSQAMQTVLMEGPKKEPGSYQLGIYLDGWLIGDIFLHLTRQDECFIGYTLDPSYWHQGYAYEALTATLQELYQQLDLHHYYAYIHPDNLASIRLIQKLGFKQLENGIYYLKV